MNTTLGEFLASRRKEKSLTQKELASKLFVSESTVSKWEQNRANPDITMLPALAEILEVSEHELVTASIDSAQRENNKKAKKWSNLNLGWHLFFFISYGITLLTCFIVDLSTGGGLSWFFIVLSALVLSATFTTLPAFVKKAKLLIITLSELTALVILLGVCCLYTDGNWFWVATVPTVMGFLCVFLPIYINVYSFSDAVKKNTAVISLVICTAFCAVMLYVVEKFTVGNGFTEMKWATPVALPLLLVCAGVALVFIAAICYVPLRRIFKCSITLGVSAVGLPFLLLFTEDVLHKNFDFAKRTSYLPKFTDWTADNIGNNVVFIVIITLAVLSVCFFGIGMYRSLNTRKK